MKDCSDKAFLWCLLVQFSSITLMKNEKCALANRSLSRLESVRRELEGERRLREERERWIPRPGVDQC